MHDPEGYVKYFGVSLDHKVIGIQYTITALVLDGLWRHLFAMIFRTELAASQLQFLTTTFTPSTKTACNSTTH
jgi:heme/copper-type cytochrome/quinol oxidase subunit 1